jgi:hypothetical protein
VVLGLLAVGCTVDSQGIGKLGIGWDGGGGDGGPGGTGGTGGGGGSGGLGGGGSGGQMDAARDVGASVDGPTPPQANGWPCSSPSGCASGYCVDNVCCESSCNGVCVACARVRTGKPDGQCRAIPVEQDPEQECAEDGTPCGRTGACNGNGACAVAAADVVCGDSACTGNVLTPAPRCNGAGSCEAKADTVCPANRRCENATTCKTTCTGDGDCVTGSSCDTSTGRCGDLIPLGGACDPSNQGADCVSGHCVDGFCCDRACGGLCRACSLAKTGVANGTCAPVSAGIDPDADCDTDDPETCGNDGTCDGAGACRQYADGTICAVKCDSGGAGGRLSEYRCRLGDCDMGTAVTRESCNAGTCCCEEPTLGGAPACVASAALCADECGGD